jgi:hypothetical protein
MLLLAGAGVDLNDPLTDRAWRFYNGLQERLDTTFTTAFSGLSVTLFAGGTPGTTYDVQPPVLVPCRTRRGTPGVKRRRLGFQVNGAGGVSYGCRDDPCQDQEEQRRADEVARPQTDTVTTPAAEPVADPATVPRSEDEAPVEAPDYGLPIVVAGGGATLTAAGIAYARRRARQLAEQRIAREVAERAAREAAARAARRQAARNVIDLAERRAARAAAARTGGRAAGKVAARAIAIAELAAGLVLVFSGEAEARVGFGPSPLEALYDSMTRNGAPPSDEMKALIQNDPVLRELAEAAAQSGDTSAFNEEATRRLAEIIRANPDAFSPEELEVLRQAAAASGGSGSSGPRTAAELRAAVDAAIARQGQPPPAGTGGTGAPGGAGSGSGSGGTGGSPTVPEPPGTGGGTGSGGTGPAGAGSGGPASTPGGSSDVEAEVDRVRREHPRLSPAVQGRLAAAPAPLRALFRSLLGPGAGLPVNDALVTRFLEAVPTDLTEAEQQRLSAGVRPITSEDLEAVIASLREAVAATRRDPSAEPGGAVAAEGDTPAPAPSPDRPAGGGGTEGEGQDPDAVVAALRRAIDSFGSWDSIGPGQAMFTGRLRGVAAGQQIGLYYYTRQGSVRGACFVQARVTAGASRPGQLWRGVVVSSTRLVGDNGAVVGGFAPGARISGRVLP